MKKTIEKIDNALADTGYGWDFDAFKENERNQKL